VRRRGVPGFGKLVGRKRGESGRGLGEVKLEMVADGILDVALKLSERGLYLMREVKKRIASSINLQKSIL